MRKQLAFLVVLNLGLTACMPDSLTKYREDPVLPAAAATAAPANQVNLQTLSYFQVVNATTGDKFALYRDKANNVTPLSDCRIEKSVINGVQTSIASNPASTGIIGTDADVTCYMNADELELYFKGLKLQLQVPAGICSYVSYDHYYFYQYQPKNSDPNVINVTNETYALGTGAGCTLPTQPAAQEKPDCVGDYTEDDGPNCDEGSVRIINNVRTFTDAAAGPCTTSTVTSSFNTDTACGGKRGNCLAGPAKDHQDSDEISKFPRLMILDAFEGVNKEWEFQAPIQQSHRTNLYIANYTNKCSAVSDISSLTNVYSHELDGVCLNGTAIVPAQTPLTCEASNYTWRSYKHNLTSFGDNSTRWSGSSTKFLESQYDPMKGANPFYTYSCLDEDFEVIGRIRVLVRDWNVRFSKTGDESILVKTNDVTKMDRVGTEPGGVSSYNDKKDWDDMLYSAGYCDYSPSAPPTTVATSESRCIAAGAKWILHNQGICHLSGFTSQATCIAGGLCSNGTSPSQTVCEIALAEWVTNTWDSNTSKCVNPAAIYNSMCAGGSAGGSPTWVYTSCVDTSTNTPHAFTQSTCEVGECSNGIHTTSGSCTVAGGVWTAAPVAAATRRFWTGYNCVKAAASLPSLCNGATEVWAHGCQAGAAPLFSFPGEGL